MERSKIDVFVLDWEGCCSYPGGGRHPWPSQDLSDLSRMINTMYRAWEESTNNPRVVLCTGRQIPYGEAALQQINAFFDHPLPSILENGAALYLPTTKEVILNSVITADTKVAMTGVRAKAYSLVEKFNGEREHGKEYCISLNPPKFPKVNIEYIDEFMEIARSEYNAQGEEVIDLFYGVVRKELRDYVESGIIEITHSKSAVDITPAGVNKGSGVQDFCDYTGISPRAIVGVGDSLGDKPLLSIVGYPACPANADDETRKLVENRHGYVSPHECAKGVEDVFKHYLPGL